MAIIQHFEAYIVVDGEPLPEYKPDEDEIESLDQPNTAVHYIESVSDAEFSVKFVIGPRYKMDCDFLSWDITVDGRVAARDAVQTKDIPKRRTHPFTSCREGIRYQSHGQWFKEHFKFSDMSFGEQTYQKDQVPANQISAVGAIKVELWRQKFRENMMNVQQGRPFCPLEKISEKSTKGQALSHTVGLAPIRPSEPANRVFGDRIGEPLVTFIFKYRSKKALRDLMIIPRSPSPSLPPEERPVETLTVEEMRELIQRQRAEAATKEEAQPGVKRERGNSSVPIRASSFRTARSPIEPDSDIECTGSRPLKKTKVEKISLLDG